MRYYLIAGERSGDLHASYLMKELKQQDQNADFRFWGGDQMQAVGGTMVKHYKEMNFMGFLEVFMNLPTILGLIKDCKADLLANRPDVLILVDYAGFNMRMARFAKENGIKVFYYISPKVWAWNSARANKIKAYVDRMFCILPFEKDFFKNYNNYEVDYIGNPSLDEVASFTPNPDFYISNKLDQNKPILAVLPGSRKQEIDRILHVMMSVIHNYTDHQIVIAGVENLSSEYYELFHRNDNIHILYGQTYDILAHAKLAVVTSGTAVLETALFEVPQVACYRTSFFTALIAKLVLRIPFVTLPNLIVNREIVKELLQYDFDAANLIKEIDRIVSDKAYHQAMMDGYKEMKIKLGEPGAPKKAAKLMYGYLRNV